MLPAYSCSRNVKERRLARAKRVVRRRTTAYVRLRRSAFSFFLSSRRTNGALSDVPNAFANVSLAGAGDGALARAEKFPLRTAAAAAANNMQNGQRAFSV